jgi:hypothetical protein
MQFIPNRTIASAPTLVTAVTFTKHFIGTSGYLSPVTLVTERCDSQVAAMKPPGFAGGPLADATGDQIWETRSR